MSEEEKIKYCPFNPGIAVRDMAGFLPATLELHRMHCIKENCMAWYDPYGNGGYCKLIGCDPEGDV